jgi:hypothetical protein
MHELSQHPSEMSLVDHDDVIEALCADGLNEPFRDRVGLRRLRRRPHASDSEAAGPRIEIPAVDGVPVVDQVSGLATPRNRLKWLLPDPDRRRTGRDVEVDQLTAVVADEEEDVQDPVVNGVGDQEIGCPDALELIREESPPSNGRGFESLCGHQPNPTLNTILDDKRLSFVHGRPRLSAPSDVKSGDTGERPEPPAPRQAAPDIVGFMTMFFQRKPD